MFIKLQIHKMIELLGLKQSLIKNAVCIRIIFQGQTKKCKLIKIYAIIHHNILIINKNKKRTNLFYFYYSFFCFFSLCFLHFYSLPYMVRTLSKDTQNNIKNLLKFDYAYSTYIKRILGVQKSTIREYKRKFFPEHGAISIWPTYFN
jgi:hypothetical protein